MSNSFGPFHSLSLEDKRVLVREVSEGQSVLSVARRLGCNYFHALNFCHHTNLVAKVRGNKVDRDSAQALEFKQLIGSGMSINAAAHVTGLGSSAAYGIASDAGLHRRRSHYQRRVDNTSIRVEYLRLRLASLTPKDAGNAVGVTPRRRNEMERGVVSRQGKGLEFVPAGVDARTYNRLMTALRLRNDAIETGRLPEPHLPSGVDPYARIDSRYLSIDERIIIADMHNAGLSCAAIARELGRHRSTITREIKRNHSSLGPYRPDTAQKKACARRLRPKVPKLIANPRLYDFVVNGLRAQWSPEEISHRVAFEFPNDKEMRISHETIYDAFYLESKGRLKNLGLSLPTGRKKRKKQKPRSESSPVNRFVDHMILIDDRPAEVEERILPGHWEGDLILGKANKSAVITLVERVSRFIVLGHLPTNHSSDEVLKSLKDAVASMDESIWSSITWDQGSEMAGHKAFTMATNIPVYFCHPGSPWERGSNENTNQRLRRNLPKGEDLSKYDKHDLEMIANIHNHKPRRVLGWRTPAEVEVTLV